MALFRALIHCTASFLNCLYSYGHGLAPLTSDAIHAPYHLLYISYLLKCYGERGGFHARTEMDENCQGNHSI